MPQSFTCLHYHIVFSTKERGPMIGDDIRNRLYKYIGGVLSENKSRLVAIGGMPDHVHLLASISTVCVPKSRINARSIRITQG